MAGIYADFRVISTLRYDPELISGITKPLSYPEPTCSSYYLLPYHCGRLLDAAVDFQWTAAVSRMQRTGSVEQFAESLNTFLPDKSRPWRLRILLDHEGELAVEASPVVSPLSSHIFFLPLRPSFSSLCTHNKDVVRWKLRLDTQPTEPSLFTRHKTTARDMYNAARTRANLPSLAAPIEVLMYNLKGEVTEGSITTVYFKKRVDAATYDPTTGDGGWVTPLLTCGGNSATTRRYALDSGICSEDIIRIDTLKAGEEVWLSNGARGFMPATLEL
ncbi:hypothetical protein MGYG_02572 [Nannizzia gypsea CBS 118893]|uniref:Aminodeoxychorismate lyase n=1 Tax=Arthroderma gypseum (strain ATCC MYA-4604 / CBS 118893) TaxID=535722 RepID=E4UN99_ARTGP|nr:hypothetical protein MGYG_02572 [Nannizzia gypsea CBS 118893]EFQ99560.1 hypothetical protein MGYG_02572 [Nannizzia gypsea CBS 118893]